MDIKGLFLGTVMATSTFTSAIHAETKEAPSKSASELGLSEKDYQDFVKALDSVHETKLSDGDLVAWNILNYECKGEMEA